MRRIVKQLFIESQCWIAYFGFPKKLHSDCGGEFCNEVLREMIDIETNTTTLQVKLLSVMGLWRETIKLCMSLWCLV